MRDNRVCPTKAFTLLGDIGLKLVLGSEDEEGRMSGSVEHETRGTIEHKGGKYVRKAQLHPQIQNLCAQVVDQNGAVILDRGKTRDFVAIR